MQEAMHQARLARESGEVPIGAVIVCENKIIAKAHNLVQTKNSAIAHAEILAIEQACLSMNSKSLTSCDLYVTLEPCAMCASAISLVKIKRLYFAACEPKTGAVFSNIRLYNHGSCNHRPEIYHGFMEQESEKLLKDFFSSRR